MVKGPDITLRPSPARVARATVLALALGGFGFVMFYFGGLRSGSPVPFVLGLVTVVLAAWLESQMFGFIRLRDGRLTAFSVVGGRKVVPVSDIVVLIPRDSTTQRARLFWTFRYTRHTLEVDTATGPSGILLDINGFGKQKVEALVSALGVPVSPTTARQTGWNV
jgi:hypothetical protein